MRRSWPIRLATAFLAVFSGLTPVEGATVPVCPVPDMPMAGMAHGAAAGHMAHTAHAAGAPAGHQGRGHDASHLHGCTCPGACAVAVALPATASAAGAAACSSIATSVPSSDVAPRGAADHFLPFPSGPPRA